MGVLVVFRIVVYGSADQFTQTGLEIAFSPSA